MSEDRFITPPEPTPFLNPATKKVAKVRDDDGKIVDAEPKTHAWFMHTYILSHPIFSMKVGGYDAVRDQKMIGRSIEKAEEEGAPYYAVSARQLGMIHSTMSTPPDKKDGKDAIKSAAGMGEMTNFESWVLFDHMDALMNATTNEPEPPRLPEVTESLLCDDSATQAEAAV